MPDPTTDTALSSQQRRKTHQRNLVLNAVQSRCDHPTADDIYLAVRSCDQKISRATVYRNLHLLVESGDIRSLKIHGSERFDRDINGHAHIICRKCGKVADIDDDYSAALDLRAQKLSNYVIYSHATYYEGLCPACQAKLKTRAEAGANTE